MRRTKGWIGHLVILVAALTFLQPADVAWAQGGSDYPQWPVRLLIAGSDTNNALAVARAVGELDGAERVAPVVRDGVGPAGVITQLGRATRSGQVIAVVSHDYTMLADPAQWQLLGILETAPTACVVSTADMVGRNITMAQAIQIFRSAGSVRVASGPAGLHSWVTAQLVLRAHGLPEAVQLVPIALKSDASAVAAVVKGTAGFACAPLPQLRSLVTQKKLSVVFASSGSDLYATKPAAQTGYPELAVLDSWYGFAGPPRLGEQAVMQWQSWLSRLANDESYQRQARERGARTGRSELQLQRAGQAMLKRRKQAISQLMRRYKIVFR